MSEHDRSAELIAEVFYAFKHQEAWAYRGYDLGLAVLAALRDSGWVDPEEAAKRENEITVRDMWARDVAVFNGLTRDPADPDADTYALIARHLKRVTAERDALLPVVEAASETVAQVARHRA